MRRLADIARAERGMTIVELMVAMMICLFGLLATVAVFDQSRKVGDASEAREALAHHGERELERLLHLSWDRLGHPTMPVAGGAAPTPTAYISSGRFSFDRNDPSRSEPLKVIGGSAPGLVESTPAEWVDNQERLQGKVYRFVTELGAQARRVTVVATADPPATVPPVYLSTLVTDPKP